MQKILFSLACLIMAPAASATTPPVAPERHLFLLLFQPGPAWVAGRPMAQQDLRAHGAYHAALVRNGRSVAAGGYGGMDGGMAIVRASDLAEAQAIAAADPAIVNRVFTAEVRQWRPRFHSDQPLVDPPAKAPR